MADATSKAMMQEAGNDDIDELRRDIDRLKCGLKEICNRLWYYYGMTNGKFRDKQAQNVYDVAKFYLEGGTPI